MIKSSIDRWDEWYRSIPVAHRGLHDSLSGAPENSLPAFQRAVDADCPIELDVHLLADGEITVFHDDTLERMTNVEGTISELDAPGIRRLNLLDSSEHIPLFTEVLELVSGKVPLLIEIKSESNRIGILERALFKRLEDYQGKYAVISFNPFSLRWFKRNAPSVPRGQLGGDLRDEKLAGYKKFLLRNLFLNRISDPSMIVYDFEALPYWAVSRAGNKGLPIIGYTSKSPDDHRTALSRCDNVIFEGYTPPRKP